MVAWLTWDSMWLLLWNWYKQQTPQPSLKESWRSSRATSAQSRINTDVRPGCSGLHSGGPWSLQGWRIHHVFGSLLQCLFILWVKNTFLVSRLNQSHITASHPPAVQHCEQPGSAGSAFLLPPPRLYPRLRKGQNYFPPATSCAAVGTAQRAAGSPRCLAFNLPKTGSRVKLGLIFLSLRHPAARVSLTMGGLFWEVRDIRDTCATQSLGFGKQREWK